MMIFVASFNDLRYIIDENLNLIFSLVKTTTGDTTTRDTTAGDTTAGDTKELITININQGTLNSVKALIYKEKIKSENDIKTIFNDYIYSGLPDTVVTILYNSDSNNIEYLISQGEDEIENRDDKEIAKKLIELSLENIFQNKTDNLEKFKTKLLNSTKPNLQSYIKFIKYKIYNYFNTKYSEIESYFPNSLNETLLIIDYMQVFTKIEDTLGTPGIKTEIEKLQSEVESEYISKYTDIIGSENNDLHHYILKELLNVKNDEIVEIIENYNKTTFYT